MYIVRDLFIRDKSALFVVIMKPHPRDDSFLQRDADRDREEEIVFLASIIPKKNKKWIRAEIEASKDFEARHFLLGMNIRNALRSGGFSHFHQTLEAIWFSRLKGAVNLPEENIVLTDSLRERIRKYRSARAHERRPRLRLPLDPKEVENAKEQLERRYSIRLPEIEVRYSDSIDHALCLSADPYARTSSKAINKISDETIVRLMARGLKEDELEAIDPRRFTIFLPKRYHRYPAGLYESLWHELGHAVAHVLKVADKDNEESLAVTYSLIGLLLETKDGKLALKKAFDQIEVTVRMAAHAFRPWFTEPIPSLRWVEKYNPGLEFTNRDPDELLSELEKTIQDLVSNDREVHEILQNRLMARHDNPFILAFAAVAGAMLIISVLLSVLHVI